MVLQREELEVTHALRAILARHAVYLRAVRWTRSFRETLAAHRNEKVRAAEAEWWTALERSPGAGFGRLASGVRWGFGYARACTLLTGC